MRGRRTIIIIVLALLGLILALFYAQRRANQPVSVSPTPTPQTAQAPPQITMVPGAPRDVAFIYAGPEASFPDALPIYKTMFSQSDTWILEAATRLGFSQPVRRSFGPQQYHLMWEGGTGSLFYNKSVPGQLLNYHLNVSAVKEVDGRTYDEVFQWFLGSSLGITTPLSLSAGSLADQDFTGLSLPDVSKGQLRGYSYSFLIDSQYPVLLNNFSAVSAAVVFDQNKTIRSLTLSVPPQAVEIGETTPILSLADAVANLNNGRGLPLFVVGQTTQWGVTPSFSRVSLTGASLGYLLEKSGLLVPVFLFKGTAVAPSQEIQEVSYLLYASPQ